MSTATNIAVIGGGRWASALATVVGQHKGGGHPVGHIWQVRPPRAHEGGVDTASRGRGGPHVELTADLRVIGQADLILLAAPARAVRGILRTAGAVMHGGQFLVHGVGSLESGDSGALSPISEVVQQETPVRRIGALAGPALAQDLEEGRPAALLCGSRFDEVGDLTVRVLSGRTLRVYTTRDIVGVELARALVAAVALAGGVAQALNLGPAARAVLVTRGAAEMARLGVALGGQERTFYGLAGVGELVVATEGRGSADFELGRLLARGTPLEEAQRQVGRTVDGPTMVREGLRLARQHRVRMTILTALDRWLSGARTTAEALSDLFAGAEHAE
jgi:glycerol-3-phosphate dehydrogenase (NAD(P)+)